MSLLELSACTGVLACALLVFRLLGTWRFTSPLTKALGVTLLLVLMGQVFGSTQTLKGGGHLDPSTVRVIFTGRLLVVALCLAWPWRE